VQATLRRLVPAPLRDPGQRWPLLGWLGVGLAVRALLMPFAVSADLLAVYWRSHLIAYEGQVFGAYLVNMGAHYVHALSLRVLAPLLPPPDELWTDPWWWSDSGALSPQVQYDLSTAEHVHQTLFALKLPYLAADLLTGLLLLAVVRAAAPHAIRRAWAFWMLSPIGLYAAYVFSRYEPLAIVLVVAALLCAERDRPWWSALLLGLAITMRGYPLLLVPVFALVVFRRPLRQAAWAAVAVAPFLAIMASNRLLAGTVGELAGLRDLPTGSTFFAFTLPVEARGEVYLFFLGMVLLVGLLAGRAWGWWGRPAERADLWLWLLLAHGLLFGPASFSAHYFMWFTPFVALALARRPQWRGVLPLHLVQAVLVLALVDLLGGPGTLTGLFEPVQPQVATALPNLREALLGNEQLTLQLLGLLRTAFLGATILLVAPALREVLLPTATAQATAAAATAAQADDREREAAGQER
jgi:hypothetical protein